MPSPGKRPQTRASSKKQQGPVRYRVFGGSAVNEVVSLEEFLASAVSHNWIIVLQVPKLPPGPNAWCPSLQPTLLEKGELSKELKATNCLTNLVVADASDPVWQRKIREIVDAESAFINMQNLLEKEDGSPEKKKKRQKQTRHKALKASTTGGKGKEDDVQTVEHGMQQVTKAGKEMGEDDEMLVKAHEDVLMAEQTTAGKEKGGDGVKTEGKGKVAEIEKDVVTGEDVLMVDEGTEEVTTTVKTQSDEGQSSHKAGKEKGGDGVKTEGKGKVAEIEKDAVTGEDVLMADEGTEEVTTTVKTQSDEGQPSHKEDDLDDFFFEGGKILHKGKPLSGLEMMVQFLNGLQGLRKDLTKNTQDIWKTLKNQAEDLQGLRKDTQAIWQTLENQAEDLQAIGLDIREVNKSLSSTAERVSRLSLALLHGQYTGARVEYPVTTRWIPYNPVDMNTQTLENLAALYKPLPKDTTNKGKPSGLVEVDILIKILKEEAGHKVYTSPMTMKTSRLLADQSSTFTHVVLGESSRSMHLCASAAKYQHPQNPCRTPSAKLLKKFVQVERGIVATLFYYDAPRHGALVDAAVIISPSFRQLTDPESLLHEVLSYTQGALPNVSRLASERRMWLIDA